MLEMTESEFFTRGGLLDKLMGTVFDASILVNADGILLHIANNTDMLQNHPEDQYIGKHVLSLNPYADLVMDTLKTHKGHWGVTEMVQGRQCLINTFPVFNDGNFLGLLSFILYSSLASLNKVIAQLGDALSAEDNERVYATIARAGNDLTFDDYIGTSAQIIRVIEQCSRAAKTHLPILIAGESGTGKEILASAIHSVGVEHTWKPFIKINCSAIPKELMESELFGYEKGAFTGASSLKKGKFELAAGGSVLLDEIGDMDVALQSKLLRVLEEKEFERVGGTKMLPMTARIISSTNSDLRQKIDIGAFRSDLYYRLNAIEIKVPPLRDHIEDIPALIQHLASQDKLDISLDDEAMKVLMNYSWPGNVRELRNIINRLGLFCTGSIATAADVRLHIGDILLSGLNSIPKNIGQDNPERDLLVEALTSTGYNIPATAEKLGVCRATIYNMMNRHGVKKQKKVYK